MTRKSTEEEILASFHKKHQNSYSYLEFFPVNNTRIKSTIICPTHGKFYQSANAHASGYGCPKCSGRDLTLDELIEEFNKAHDYFYDYSKFIYRGCETKGVIICPIHGEFQQTSINHKRGQGCPDCGIIRATKKNSYTLEEIIIKFNKKHDNRYDYSEFIYIDAHTKGIIICPIHGRFDQMPYSHLVGIGCPDCGTLDVSSALSMTLDEFVVDANKKHDCKYGYEKFIYRGSKVKGTITCPKHGDFQQTPNAHLRGNGCPVCKSSKGEKNITEILNSLGIKYERQKRFPDCKDVGILPFDFYLPDHNLLIEFDGRHHFIPVSFGSSKDLDKIFQNVKHKDNIKNEFCIANNLRLLRIPYTKLANATELITETINN